MGGLKIRRIHLRGFQQFADTVLDFTNPETGEVADRVCFIGRNGTGKSTILRLLDDWLNHLPKPKLRKDYAVTLVLKRAAGDVAQVIWPGGGRTSWRLASGQTLVGVPTREEFAAQFASLPLVELRPPDDTPDLIVVQRVDVVVNQGPDIQGVPATTLSDALALMRDFPVRHEVSDAAVNEMWRLLVFLVKRRESERQAFELLPENINKTKANLIAEFDAANRPVLEGLALLWNRILEPAGLQFDVAGATVPVQLNENLHAYIRHKGTGDRIAYSALSTGIRNFLFRTGHLYLLYFNRTVERGFVLIDEPEDSLFPDFLFELSAVWEEILGKSGTQLFVATHSPIVAAQFEPWQRVVLEWDGHGHVTAKHGRAPKGDDPNDVLRQDFDLPELMGPAGVQAWRRYLDLRDQVDAGGADKAAKIEEMADLARRYGFAGDEA
jgi:energy-coupling factor transporter ATP-binding protein EcfA2